MREIVIVVFDGFQSLDVSGPAEVLARGGALADAPYTITLVSGTGAPATASPSGLRLLPDARIDAVRGPIDTLMVAGGDGTPDAQRDRRLVEGIRRLAGHARRVTSVCTGAFLLAEAGLLDDRRATTHWGSLDALAREHPSVTVERDPIFVRDGNVWTSAGVTAGMDLALALVEDDHGRDIALRTARRLVMYAQRAGGQSQFSAALRAQTAERQPLRDVQAWMTDNLDADLSVGRLAERAAMSPRNFARAFATEVGVTPARYVEELRIEAARRLIETTSRPVQELAQSCGFGTAETMRRAFVRRIGVAPTDYRKHFHKETA